MPNTSATGGFLPADAAPAPQENDPFEDFLQAVVAGVSGLPGTSVFPRWQPEPPNQPNFPDNWAAFGITDYDADYYAYVKHAGAAQGHDNLQRNEELTVLLSFYGPLAASYMAQFRDGIQIAQNREVLQLAGVAVKGTGRTIPAPSLVKERWVKRLDMSWYLKRVYQRNYPVLNVLSGQLGLVTDVGIGPVPIIVTGP